MKNDHIKLDEEEESQNEIKQEAIEIHEQQSDLSINNRIINNEHHQIEMKSIADELNHDSPDQSKIEPIYPDASMSPIPEQLKKTFFLSVSLFVIGTILIIIGLLNSLIKKSIKEGITFWVLGLIVFTPGGYYTYLFYQFKKANNLYDREAILSQIPEL